MKLNGSLRTIGGDNIFPLNTWNKELFNNSVVLHLDMEGDDGTYSIIDRSPIARTIINNPINGTNRVEITADDKMFGTTSAYFNNSDGLILPNNSDFTFDGQFTISFWMKSNVYSLDTNARRIFSLGTGNSYNIELLANSSAGTNSYLSIYSGTTMHNGTIVAFNNIWNHILLSRDLNSVIRLFVNGVLSVSYTDSTVFLNSNVFIGKQAGVNNYSRYVGYLDDFYILKGICQYMSAFDVPTQKFSLYDIDSSIDYSGITMDGRVGEDIQKGKPVYFDVKTKSWKLAKSNQLSTLPARAIAVNDCVSGETARLLTFGTLKLEKENTRYQDYTSTIPSGINSNVYNGYYIRRSSTYSDGNYEAWKAFYPSRNKQFNQFGTGATYIYWQLGGGYNNSVSWIRIQLPSPKILKSYVFRERGGYTNQNPVGWRLRASKDGVTWVLLDNQVGWSTWSDNQSRTFIIDNDEEYLYYEFFDFYMMGLGQIIMYDDNGGDIVPNMSNGTLTDAYTMTYNGYIITWNQHYSTSFAGWYAFNKTTSGSTCWYSSYANSPYNEYETCSGTKDSNGVLIGSPILDILLPNPIKLDILGYYHCPWSRGGGSYGYFELYGSNDCGINWDHLLTFNQNDIPLETICDNWPYLFNIENSKYYSQYRFSKIGNAVYGFDFLTRTKKDPKTLYVQPDNIYQYEYGLNDNVSSNPEFYIQKCGHKVGEIHDSTTCYNINFYNFETSYVKSIDNNLGNVTISSSTNLSSTSDGDMITAVYQTLTINSGYTLSTLNRCRGLRIIVLGNCIINGTLSMTARGANYPPPNDDLPIYDLYGNLLATVPRIGSIGAPTNTSPGVGTSGTAGVDRGCGGGGGGGGYGAIRGGGGIASCYSGGAGGGGFCAYNSGTGNSMDGRNYGGRGGDGYYSYYNDTYYCRGGVGNPGGSEWYRNGSYVGAAPTGTGGLLILIVYGNLTIGSTGIICSDGTSANSGSTTCLGGGGGSGGGSVNIFYKGILNNSGTLRANGGTGTTTSYSSNSYIGGNGGAGSIQISKF